jgi:flavin reductase (DIM6/NTAB) family NADH-FMN oxidoreductase RutF
MMTVNADIRDDFRSAMRRLASTVSIVTCIDGNEWLGMTATAMTSVCVDPAAVLICVNADSRIHSPLLAGGRFCINMLQSSQSLLSEVFSGRVRGKDRFSSGNWMIEERGLPYLADAQANLFCRIDHTVPYGTHSIVIGLVEGVRVADVVSPLIYQNGRYASTIKLDDTFSNDA